MRTRTRGIQLASDGSRTLNQEYKGRRIFERLGKVSQAEAEGELTRRRAAIDTEIAHERRVGAERLWADGARKYLIECQQRKVRTLDLIAYHVSLLLPYIGTQPMGDVCNDSLEEFKLDRQDDGVKNATINRSLEVVRTVMNRAARVWRDEGKPWLSAPPLIEMLDEAAQKRDPYPLSWHEQGQLLPQLPSLNADMLEFSLNTGARDENVCGLRWDWEVKVPELKRSVFVIPPEHYKTNRKHVLILNDTAWKIIERHRGRHDEFVFVYRRERTVHVDQAPAMEYHRVGTQNNTAFQGAREAAKLAKFRIHDARHTFGQRLRDAGVSAEDRGLLLGHAVEDMPGHYASATVARLVDAANSVTHTRDRVTLLKVANG
jgi:integrase